MTALERISPEVTEYFDVDYLNDSSDGQSCYQISRSGPLLVGSFLTGPHKVHRLLTVGDQAEIAIEIEAPWYYLSCGKPRVALDFSPNRGNEWLAKRLETELP